MAKSTLMIMNTFLLLIASLSIVFLRTSDAQTGACYGTLGDNLPPAAQVIALCKQHNIQRMRLYNPNPSVLETLKGSNISVIVGVANEDIVSIANDPLLAKSWVQNNVLRYPNVAFRYIAVGNEIIPSGSGSGSGIAPSVAPAMSNIYGALAQSGLGSKVRVSTALSMGVLAQSYPPSKGEFRAEYVPSFIGPVVKFLSKTKSPFLLNVYPYFAYASDTHNIRLDYAIFTSPSSVVKDGPYQYQNLFSAMVDATRAALEKAGAGDVEVVVSETGWPSAGGTSTTVENARLYNTNLIRSVKQGTPRKPGKELEAYVFDLIDEDQKSPELEKHWGVFLADGTLKYPIKFY